jgi:hypothetical protein
MQEQQRFGFIIRRSVKGAGMCNKSRFVGNVVCIKGAGGIYKNAITKKTDYLIVGNDGNLCWVYPASAERSNKRLTCANAATAS